jgi:hypothetical protein
LNRSIDIGRLFGSRLRVHRMLLWLIAILVVSNLMSGGVPVPVPTDSHMLQHAQTVRLNYF